MTYSPFPFILKVMKVKLHPEIEKLLKEVHTGDLEKVINDIVFTYASGGFIRRADVVGAYSLDDIYNKLADNVEFIYEEITNNFQGVAVVGKSVSESSWVCHPGFLEALEKHTVVLVMKSPRKKDIRTERGPDIRAMKDIKN